MNDLVQIALIVIAWAVVPILVLNVLVYRKLWKLTSRNSKLVDIAEKHSDLNDRKEDVTREAFTSLQNVAATAAEHARNAALAAETRLGRKIEKIETATAEAVVKKMLEGGSSAPVEMHGPKHRSGSPELSL